MIGIIIITFNIDVRVFLLQIEAIRKFCKDPFEIRVFDNSDKKSMAENIRHHAGRLQVSYTRLKSGTKDPSQSHAFAANFASRSVTGMDYILMLDHDCIPIKGFSIRSLTGEGFGGGLSQRKSVSYFWPGCFMWNTNKISLECIDFSPNHELGLDTGGMLYKMIEAYWGENFSYFDEVYAQNPSQSGFYSHYSLLADETFIHFINGSNWNNQENDEQRINSLLNITEQLMSHAE
jgi:hypothetical protein